MVLGRRDGATVAAFGDRGMCGGKAGWDRVFVQGGAREFRALFLIPNGQGSIDRRSSQTDGRGLNQGRYRAAAWILVARGSIQTTTCFGW